MKYINYQLLVISLFLFFLGGCKQFLDEKPNPKIVTPRTLEDLNLLLDAAGDLNYNVYPGLVEINTDDFYLTTSVYNGLTDFYKSLYRFEKNSDFIALDVNFHWRMAYKVVFYANTILDELNTVQGHNIKLKNEIKGKALFFRAFAFWEVAKLYAVNIWDEDKEQNKGIPLRMSANINEVSTRSSITQTYKQIFDDLLSSVELLPAETNFKTQPTKNAAYALLARISLTNSMYAEAYKYANYALQGYSSLMDYNDMNLRSSIPFDRFNKETIFYAYSYGAALLNPSRANVSKDLYRLYKDDDLRKIAFFIDKGNGHIGFKGAYHGLIGNSFFNGLATDELFLIRSESSIRLGNVDAGIDDLNTLLKHRISKSAFVPIDKLSQNDALELVLMERRKELLYRGLRWLDIKRFNKTSANELIIEREIEVNGQINNYKLTGPNSLLPFLIPQEVIVKSGINQNIF